MYCSALDRTASRVLLERWWKKKRVQAAAMAEKSQDEAISKMKRERAIAPSAPP